MRYINTTNDNITFTDVDGRVVIVPKNRVYTHFKNDTITFLLVERYDKEGICLFTTLAEDLQINGVTYTYEQLLNGEGTGDMFSPTGLIIKLVDELPASGEQSTIYLIANDKGSFTEYLWLEETSKWEELGDVSKIDLSNYFTKSEINDMFANYYTQSEIDDMFDGYYTKTEVDGKLDLKANAADVYTKTEADNKFLTEHQSLDDYYTKSEVDTELADKQDKLTAGANITIDANNVISSTGGTQVQTDWNQTDDTAVDFIKNKPVFPDTSEFVTKDEYNSKEVAIAEALTDLNENKADKTEIPDVSIFATKTELNAKQDALVSGTNIKTINGNSILGEGNIEIQGGGGEQQQADWNQTDSTAVDYIKNKPTNVSAFTNDAGYLTQHQSLANYYTKSEIDAMIGNINTILASI